MEKFFKALGLAAAFATCMTAVSCKNHSNSDGGGRRDSMLTTAFYIEAADAGAKVKIAKQGSVSGAQLQSSKNGGAWEDYTFDSEISLDKKGDKVYFQAKSQASAFSDATNSSNYYCVATTDADKKFKAGGNIMSLVDPNCESKEIPADNCFYGLFYGCTALSDASDLRLPATTLKSSCYNSMFYGCTGLVNGPASLPATDLSAACYASMFKGCTGLVNGPASLPATDLSAACYSDMFNGCKSLIKGPTSLSPKTVGGGSCFNMFSDCEKLEADKINLPAKTLEQNCYNAMFKNCKAMAADVDFGAKDVMCQAACREMFYACAKLKSIKVHVGEWVEIGDNNALVSWLAGAGGAGSVYWYPSAVGEPTRDEWYKPSTWTYKSY